MPAMSARNVGHSSEIPFVIPDISPIEPTPIHLATMHIWLGAGTQTKTMARCTLTHLRYI